jgi:6-phosphogluconolactonase
MLVFVGTYTEPILFGTGRILQGKGEGIYVYRLHESSGAIKKISKTSGIANPSYLAFDGSRSFLYAVNELKSYEGKPTGTVSALAVDLRTGALELLNKQITHGTDPCHVVVDQQRKYVFVSNFMSGSVCVLPVRDDGSLGEACDVVQHHGASIDPRRQSGPHAHSVTLHARDRFAFVPDLGLDKLMIYRFDPKRGKLDLNAVPWIEIKPGAGPRQLSFHPNRLFAYLVNELDSTIAALAYDGSRGTFALRQTIRALPGAFAGESTCADIHVHPSGHFVYTSNRGHNSIVIHRIDPVSGRLTYVAHEPTQGRTPRSFGIDPTGRFLVAANQDSDSLVTFRIDPLSGKLQPACVAKVPTPVCVKVLSTFS